jgi:hypothetical protein
VALDARAEKVEALVNMGDLYWPKRLTRQQRRWATPLDGTAMPTDLKVGSIRTRDVNLSHSSRPGQHDSQVADRTDGSAPLR